MVHNTLPILLITLTPSSERFGLVIVPTQGDRIHQRQEHGATVDGGRVFQGPGPSFGQIVHETAFHVQDQQGIKEAIQDGLHLDRIGHIGQFRVDAQAQSDRDKGNRQNDFAPTAKFQGFQREGGDSGDVQHGQEGNNVIVVIAGIPPDVQFDLQTLVFVVGLGTVFQGNNLKR